VDVGRVKDHRPPLQSADGRRTASSAQQSTLDSTKARASVGFANWRPSLAGRPLHSPRSACNPVTPTSTPSSASFIFGSSAKARACLTLFNLTLCKLSPLPLWLAAFGCVDDAAEVGWLATRCPRETGQFLQWLPACSGIPSAGAVSGQVACARKGRSLHTSGMSCNTATTGSRPLSREPLHIGLL
jgi:hypothetical protein